MSDRTKIEDIRVQIRGTISNPNIGNIHQITLKDGPKVFRIATVFEILNGNTGELHHYALRLDSVTVDRNGWVTDQKTTGITNEPGELETLGIFINNVVKGTLPDEDGIFHIIPDETYERLENIVDYINKSSLPQKLGVLEAILKDIDSIAEDSPELIENNEELLKNIAIATRMVSYRQACNRLRELVVSNTRDEQAIQSILTEHPWLFGSEYSELIPRRTWTRDNRLDFMLRRSIDGYLEIIEIKTPFPEPLMLHDNSHDSYYASSRLSPVIGQVMRYIEEVERQRDYIVTSDGYDPLKIRARVIIGRDGSEDHQRALRNLNAHLYRIEILTFDQLLRIGERVLSIFEDQIGGNDDIPF